jgi:probable F420-dependent oxidoreductase
LGLSPRWYAEVARAAEAAGFDSVWVQEHVVFPAEMPHTYPYSDDGNPGIASKTPLIDPWIALTTIANATESVRLAPNVYVLPLRSPFVTARAAVTLDRVSGGRLSLGVGVGWLQQEYEAMQVEWEGRGRRMDEIIDIMRRLWSEETIEHQGEFYHFDPVCFEPKPLQKSGIPVLIGGESRPAMRRAARIGDGWIMTWLGAAEEVAEKVAAMRALRVEHGRADVPFEITGSVQRDVSVDGLRAYQANGVDRVIVDALGSRSAQDVVDALHRFRDNTASKL